MSISLSDSDRHLSMPLSAIIAESKKASKGGSQGGNKGGNKGLGKKRTPVKNTTRAKANGATAKKTQGRADRTTAANRARGITTRQPATPKKRNINASIAARSSLLKAKRRTQLRGSTLTGTPRVRRNLNGGGIRAAKNETLKITVQNNRTTGNASLGARRLRRPVRQAPQRRTQSERHQDLVVQQRYATTNRRAAGVSAARGIAFSNNNRANGNRGNNGPLRQPRNNPRFNGSGGQLRLGSARSAALSRGAPVRNNNNNANYNNNNANYNNNNDTFASFRSNRPRNRNAGQQQNRNRNNTNNNNNRNNNNRNNNYNNRSVNVSAASRGSLNDRFSQQGTSKLRAAWN